MKELNPYKIYDVWDELGNMKKTLEMCRNTPGINQDRLNRIICDIDLLYWESKKTYFDRTSLEG